MLVVVSKPVDLHEVVEEPVLQAIEDRTEKLPVQVEVLDEPTYDRLSSELGRFRPHLLHYMGHGEYDEERQTGQIALLKPDGTAWWCGDQQFAEILDRLDDRPRIVVLHACEGARVDERAPFVGMAPQLVRHGVQAVIAMRYVVTNRTAIEFSGAFYRELFAGKAVDEAAQAARWEISSVGGWGSDARLLGVPVLYLHSRNAVVLPVGSAP